MHCMHCIEVRFKRNKIPTGSGCSTEFLLNCETPKEEGDDNDDDDSEVIHC